MFILKRVASVGGITMRVPQRTSLPVSYFSACQCLRSSKRRSPYSTVDSERYSSLVKSVMSFRVSSQTPETLLVEDENIYGPIVKSQTPSTRPEMRVPKILHPFLHCEVTPEETTESEESGPPTRILLNRDKDRSFVPSVTRILQQTLSPQQIFYLERWKRKMIAELGEEGFKEYSQNLFRQGKLFHSALEDVLTSGDKNLSSDTPEHPPEVQGYLQSISHVLEDVRAVKAIESVVQHDSLGYRGIVDCVARYRGVLCVIDWKTSEKPKPFLGNTYDNPVQVAAYAGALNNDNNYKYQVESGLIVVAYKDGTPAHAHQLSSELMLQYWNKWLVRFEEFTNKSSSHASSPISCIKNMRSGAVYFS